MSRGAGVEGVKGLTELPEVSFSLRNHSLGALSDASTWAVCALSRQSDLHEGVKALMYEGPICNARLMEFRGTIQCCTRSSINKTRYISLHQ